MNNTNDTQNFELETIADLEEANEPAGDQGSILGGDDAPSDAHNVDDAPSSERSDDDDPTKFRATEPDPKQPHALLLVDRIGPDGDRDEIEVMAMAAGEGLDGKRWGKVLACIAHSVELKWGITRAEIAAHFNAAVYGIEIEEIETAKDQVGETAAVASVEHSANMHQLPPPEAPLCDQLISFGAPLCVGEVGHDGPCYH